MHPQQWQKTCLIFIASCLAVLAMSPAALAGHHGKHHKHQCPSYSDIDADGNNAVTSEEFYAFRAQRMAARAEAGGKMKNAKNAPAFEDLDLDGDGNLSADEFAEHHAQCPMRKKAKADTAEEA
jgi:hypothetical protein